MKLRSSSSLQPPISPAKAPLSIALDWIPYPPVHTVQEQPTQSIVVCICQIESNTCTLTQSTAVCNTLSGFLACSYLLFAEMTQKNDLNGSSFSQIALASCVLIHLVKENDGKTVESNRKPRFCIARTSLNSSKPPPKQQLFSCRVEI